MPDCSAGRALLLGLATLPTHSLNYVVLIVLKYSTICLISRFPFTSFPVVGFDYALLPANMAAFTRAASGA